MVRRIPQHLIASYLGTYGQPVAKLSDAPGKTLCQDPTFLAYLRQVFNHRA